MKKELFAKLINNKDDNYLEKYNVGHVFKITDIILGQSSITLYLDLENADDDDYGFNSMRFEILDEDMKPYDILKDKDINKYLHEFEGQIDIYNEFLDVLNYNDAKFTLYLNDLFIDVKVNSIIVEENYCKLFIPGGEITIWKENRVEKCIRPDNVIMECKYCYRLYSQYDDCIGYIYVE